MQPSSFVNWIALLEADEAFLLLVAPVAIIAAIGALLSRAVFGSMIATSSTVGTTKAGAAAEIYAVVLGFIILFGFEQFHVTKQDVLLEATLLDRLYSEAQALGEQGEPLEDAVMAYVGDVLVIDWPLQSAGRSEGLVTPGVIALEREVRARAVKSSAFEGFRLNNMYDQIMQLRTKRLSAAPDGVVANAIFQVLAVGIVLSVVTGWFVRGPSILVHMALSAMISGAVVFLMILSAQLLYPFSGTVAVSSAPFKILMQTQGN